MARTPFCIGVWGNGYGRDGCGAGATFSIVGFEALGGDILGTGRVVAASAKFGVEGGFWAAVIVHLRRFFAAG